VHCHPVCCLESPNCSAVAQPAISSESSPAHTPTDAVIRMGRLRSRGRARVFLGWRRRIVAEPLPLPSSRSKCGKYTSATLLSPNAKFPRLPTNAANHRLGLRTCANWSIRLGGVQRKNAKSPRVSTLQACKNVADRLLPRCIGGRATGPSRSSLRCQRRMVARPTYSICCSLVGRPVFAFVLVGALQPMSRNVPTWNLDPGGMSCPTLPLLNNSSRQI
jgi:hypothetical protein